MAAAAYIILSQRRRGSYSPPSPGEEKFYATLSVVVLLALVYIVGAFLWPATVNTTSTYTIQNVEQVGKYCDFTARNEQGNVVKLSHFSYTCVQDGYVKGREVYVRHIEKDIPFHWVSDDLVGLVPTH